MNDTTQRAGRLGRYAALAGAASAVLTVVAYLTIGPNPDSTASASTITAYYAAHHGHIRIAGILLMYAAVLFALFGIAAWARIRDSDLHPMFAGSILIAIAVATIGDLAGASSWYLLGGLGGKATISGATMQELHLVVASADMPGAAGLGAFLIAFAAAGVIGRTFPRWVSWPALALGILELVPTPGLVGFIAGLAILPWMIAASVAIFRSTPAPQTAASRRIPAAFAGRA